jgi:hypothetical protein
MLITPFEPTVYNMSFFNFFVFVTHDVINVRFYNQ